MTAEIDVISPIDGTVIGSVGCDSADDAHAALERARASSSDWARTSPSARGRVLIEAARRLRAHAAEFAEIDTVNAGRSPQDSLRSTLRAADCLEYYGGYADKVNGETIPVRGAFHTYTLREPYGVVVGIVPWNNPLFFATKKIAPALAFGNAIVLKPAEETPLSALRLLSLLHECGLPDGVAQVVVGGRDVGAALTSDVNTDLIVFTGSASTGRAVARAAAERLVPVCLELGGKSAQLVFDDCDFERALEGIVAGAFASCGQMCIAGSRVFVQSGIARDFEKALSERVGRLVAGDPRDPDVNIGPQVTAVQQAKSLRLIETGVQEGAEVLASGSISPAAAKSGGFYVAPIVFGGVSPSMTIMQDEVFGPVACIVPFETEDDAVALALDTEYGLAGGIWTESVGRAHRIAAQLPVGNVWINSYRTLLDNVPFGGVKMSGYGREGGSSAAELYTRVKSVWTSTASGAEGIQIL